jgi:hypothetical protein
MVGHFCLICCVYLTISFAPWPVIILATLAENWSAVLEGFMNSFRLTWIVNPLDQNLLLERFSQSSRETWSDNCSQVREFSSPTGEEEDRSPALVVAGLEIVRRGLLEVICKTKSTQCRVTLCLQLTETASFGIRSTKGRENRGGCYQRKPEDLEKLVHGSDQQQPLEIGERKRCQGRKKEPQQGSLEHLHFTRGIRSP